MTLRTSQAQRRIKAAFKSNLAPKQTVKTAVIVGNGLISINGQQYQAAVTGNVGDVVEVVNAGTASNAIYVSSTGGSVTSSGRGTASPTTAAGAHSLSDTSVHLGQLNPNQANWAFLHTGARPITGNIIVNDGLTIDGVDLDVHAADPDAHHPRATGGNSIAIGTDSQIVSVLLDTQSGLRHFNRDGIVGLAVDPGFGLAFTTGANSLKVNSFSDGKANPNKVLQTDTTGKMAAATLSADTLTAAADLTIAPVGDVSLFPTGNDIFIGNFATMSTPNWVSGFDNPGWGLGYNSGTGRYFADFQDMTADTMHVLAFTADVSRVAVGERLVTYSSATLAEDFLIPSNIGGQVTITIEDVPGFTDYQAFRPNDWLRVRVIDRSGGGLLVADAWGQVSSYVDLSGDDDGKQQWTFTFKYGTGGVYARAGLEVIDYGASLDGYIRDTVLDPAGAPYTEIATWTTNPYDPNNKTIHLRYGNLDGLSGLSRQWGLWAGASSTQYLLASDTNLTAAGMTLEMYDSGTKKIVMDPSLPALKMAQSGVDTFAPTAGNSGMYFGQYSGANRFYAGGASQYVLWDGTNLTVKGTLLLPDGSAPGTGVTPRGAWSSAGVSYSENDIVDYGGASYICNTAHTTVAHSNLITNGEFESGTASWSNTAGTTFTTPSGGVSGNKGSFVDPDGTARELYQTFSLAASTDYSIRFWRYSATGNVTFKTLLIDHTSPFGNRGLNETVDPGTSWSYHASHFTTTSGAAATTSRFSFWMNTGAGDTYYFDGVDIAKTASLSPDESPYWNVWGQAGNDGAAGTSFRNKGNWATATAYVADTQYIDFVSYNSSAWTCTQSHTSASSGANGPPGTGSYWSQLATQGPAGATGATGAQGTSIRSRGAWASGQTYIKSTDFVDWVTYNGSAYYALLTHTSAASGTEGPPGVGTRWQLMASKGDQGPPGANNQDFSFIAESAASLPTNYSGLYVTSSKMGYVRNGTWRTYQDNAGNFYYGGTTGNHLFWNETSGKLGGANASGVTQWYATSADGKLYAGGGSVVLEQAGLNVGNGKVRIGTDGISFTSAGTGYLRFVRTFDGVVGGWMGHRYVSGLNINDWYFNLVGTNGTYTFENGSVIATGGGMTAYGPIVARPTSTSSVQHGVQSYMPANANGAAFNAAYNNADRIQLRARAALNDIYILPSNLGNNQPGGGIFIGNNTNTGAAGAAPAFIGLMKANGTYGYLWFDNANRLRVGTQRPTGSTSSATANSETAGTIIS